MSFLALFAGACSSTTTRASFRERVGGVERTRPFASSTAYEAFLRAELAIQHNEPEEATRQLELAVLADPDDSLLASRRAELLLRLGQTQAAHDVASEACTRFPNDPAPQLALAEVLFAQQQTARALAALHRAEALGANDPEVQTAVRELTAHRAARAGTLVPEQSSSHRLTRQEQARAAFRTHDWATVERLLAPIVHADPMDFSSRITLIEARIRDGRPEDARPLLERVPVRANGIAPTERVRLWLLSGRPELAAEEAQQLLARDRNDVRARLLLGQARVALGAFAEGISLLAAIPASTRDFLEARSSAARALVRAGQPADADLSLERSISVLPADDADGRDQLRLLRATLFAERGQLGEARRVLASVETPRGRQGRGQLLALTEPPAGVLADLRTRTNDPWEDARSDAWIALVCQQHPGTCSANETEQALHSAETNASHAPETLRARALATNDRREAQRMLREALLRDPLNPWNAAVARSLERVAGRRPTGE